MTDDFAVRERNQDSRSGRRRTRELRVTAWLGAGALGVGVGAALLGGAVLAHADAGDIAATTGGASHGPRASGTKTPRSAAVAHAAGGSVSAAVASVATLPSGGGAVSAMSAVKHSSHAAAATRQSVDAPQSAALITLSVHVPRAAAAASETSPTGNAVGWHPGSVISIFISNGTAVHPDAGLLIGDGFSYNSTTCPTGTTCNGGKAGFLLGNGGNGYNGGNGGSAGLIGTGGNGGDAPGAFSPPNTVSGNGYVNGGNGGNGGLLFGNGGSGGAASTSANGGNGGNGGLFFGVGGMGGFGGPGAVTCKADQSSCTVFAVGGPAGQGGRGGLIGGVAGMDGYQTLPLSSPNFDGYTPYSNGLEPWTNQVPDAPPYQTGILENGLANPQVGNNGGYPEPYFVPGTESSVQLAAGTPVATWLDEYGNFLAPTNTPFEQLSIPPFIAVEPYVTYVVKDPAALPAGWWIERSLVSPGFGQPGGGVQYAIYASPDKSVKGSINTLLACGYLAYAAP